MSALLCQGSKNTVIAIRVFHILLGVLLAYAGYQYTQGKKMPASFYTLLIVLGLGSVGYHSYKLMQVMGYMS